MEGNDDIIPEDQQAPTEKGFQGSTPSGGNSAPPPPPVGGIQSTGPPPRDHNTKDQYNHQLHPQHDTIISQPVYEVIREPHYYCKQGHAKPRHHNYVTKAELSRALEKFVSESRGRKRKRSESASQGGSDTQESSHYVSDSESDSYGSESSVKSQTTPPAFPYNGDTFVHWNPKEHHCIDTTKIRWGGEVYNVKWHPYIDAFCLLKEPSSDTGFISPQIGHQSIVECLKLDNTSNVPTSSSRKCLDTTFGPDLGMFKLLSIIKEKEKEINHLLVLDEANNTEKAMEKIPNEIFKSVSMANFSTGWNFSSCSYLDWAKEEQLNVEQAAIALEFNFTVTVSSSALKEELKARTELVNYLSGLKLLELFSTKFEDKSKTSALLAISQHFLPMLKRLVIEWMISKISVRKIFLKNNSSTASSQLLKSSLWDNKIFPDEAINLLKDRGQQRSVASMIYGGSHSSSFDPYSRQRKRRRKEEKSRFYKPKRTPYHSDYTDSAYSTSSYPQNRTRYKKDRDTKKHKKSTPRSKKEGSPSDSKVTAKGRKFSQSSTNRNKKK